MNLVVPGLPAQLELWSDTRSDVEIAMVGPYGCGKSLGLAVKQAMLRVVNRECDGLLVVPSFPIARKVHFREWPEIWRRLLGITVRHNKQENCFEWPWGTRTNVGTADKPESLIGQNVGDVTFDEPGVMDLEAWERGSVRGRDPRAVVRQVVLGGTPEGLNWFADLFSEPAGTRRTIRARHWHADIAGFYPAQLIERFGYDESLLASYVRGQFVPLRVGRAWRFYDPGKHGAIEPAYSEHVPLVLACDFNVDAMRWEIGQFHANEIRWLDEIALGRDGSTEAAAREFVRRWPVKRHRGQLVVVGDASGQARSTSGRADYAVLREELKRGGFENVSVRLPEANPRVKDRVDNTNYHLAGRGKRIVVSKRCKELRKDWERCAWREGTAELDKSDPMRTHAAEAADYATWMLARVTLGDRARGGKVRTDGLSLGAA